MARRVLTGALDRFRTGSPLPSSQHDVLGDLEEEWREIRRDRGSLRAGLWYGFEAARISARLALEAVRRRGVLRGLRDDARSARRGLRRNPVFSAFAVLTLGMGVGAATVWFPAAESTLLHPAGKLDPDRVVDLWAVTDGGTWTMPSAEQVDRWAEMDHVFDAVHRFTAGDVSLMVEGAAIRGTAVAAGPDLFEFLGGTTPLGRYFDRGEAQASRSDPVVLSWEFWQGRMGGPADVLGRSLVVDGKTRSVVGVVERGLTPPGWRPGMVDVWLPPEPGHHSVLALARLAPGVDVEAANAALAEVVVGSAEETGTALSSGSVGSVVSSVVRAGGGVVGLLVLIAGANVATLMVQRRLRRRRELAFRAALGAGAGRLTRVAVLEGALLGLGAAVLGVLAAVVGLHLLEQVRPERAVGLMGLRIGLGTAALGAAVGLTVGIVSAAIAGAPGIGDPARMTGRAPEGREGARLRWFFLAGQVAVSYALLVVAVTLAARFHELRGRDPGYDPTGLAAAVIDLPAAYEEEEARGRAFQAVRDAVASVEGVDRALLAVGIPPGMEVVVDRPRPEGEPPPPGNALLRGGRVEPGFLSTLGAPLLAGRLLRPDDLSGAPVAVVGETLARRLWGELDPEAVVGRRVVLDELGAHTVVGVVRDIRVAGLAEERPPLLLFRPIDRWGTRLSVVFRSDADPEAVFPRVASAVRSVDPQALVGVYTGTEALAETIAIDRFLGGLFGVAAWLALLLSGLGLYGVLSQAVLERYRELGVRASLGAGALRLRWNVLSSAASVTAAGLALGALAGGVVLRWTPRALLPGTPTVVHALVAALILVAVAMPAVWLPAARATRVDPAEALRAE